MKKNKLYTANKWNRPAFMVDREHHNIFDGLTLGQSSLMTNKSLLGNNNNSNPFGIKPLSTPTITPRVDWSNSAQAAVALGKNKAMLDNFSFNAKQMVDSFGTGKDPLQVGLAPGIGNAVSGSSSGGNLISKMGGVDGIMGAVGGISTQVSDMLSGGHSSGVGTGLKTIGGLVKNIPVVGKFGVAAELVGGAIDGLFGGPKVDEGKARANAEGTAAYNNYHAEHSLDAKGPEAQANVQDAWTNSLFGGGASAKNEEARQARREAKQKAYRDYANMIHNVTSDQLNNALANFSAFGGPLDMGGGALDYGLAMDYLTMKKQQNEAKNKVSGISPMPAINTFGHGGCFNPFALGGDIEVPQDNTKVFRPMMLPIQRQQNFSDSEYFWDAGKEYPAGLWKHKDGTFHTTGSYGNDIVLTQEEADSIIRATKTKNRREKLRKAMENHKQTNSSENLFAFGGDMQTNSSDFPTGLMHIDAGGSHEMNPNDGVQIGIDQQGIPNLVEEGERIFNNYVFSKRIYADGGTLEKFHLSKKRKITFADLAELLEKEIAERPNDPLSQAGFTKQMEMLEEQQERQKQEMDAQRAKEAFEALSPEEQVAVIENAAQEEQAAQQQAMQEQALAQQGISPEEAAMAQEQMMADGSQPNLGQEPQMACYGGKLFADGGDTKKNIFRALGKATDNDFIKWLEENGLTQLSEGYNDIDWNNILTDDAFISALTKDDAALADAIKKGYSFGAKTPTKDGIVFTDPDRGNWDRQMFEGWNGSKDDAWIELVKAHGIDKLKGMKREALEKAFKETNAYKNTTKWLQSNPENMRRYLKSVLDTSSSKSAKKHALQFVNEDGTWKNASKIPTYAQIFGENGKGVRETYPGTYWHSVREANIGNRARNLVWNPENEGWDEVVGDVGKDWALDSSYDFYNEKDNLNDRVNYYYRSEGQDDFKPVTAEEAKEAEAAEKMKNFKPKYRKGLFGVDTLGPLAALTMQGLGIGRGDTSMFDAAASGAGNFTTASWMPRGDFMKLKLTDPWRYTMPMLANSRATDRAILNSGANQGAKMAGLLANGYNTTIGLGEAALKGDDVNWQRYVTQKTHDAGVHEGNQREYGVTSRFNAGAYNDAARASANARMQAAAQRFSADRDWYGSLYGNVGNFFGSLTSHKKENDTHNMIADMAANGIFGVITPNSPMGQRYLQWVNSSAEGGKVEKKKNKRRGLTF